MRALGMAMLLMATLWSSAYAKDCAQRQLPDGTWTAECPSEAPSAPPAPAILRPPPAPPIPPILYTTTCRTPRGSCLATFSAAVRPGEPCNCADGATQLQGRTEP